jgi:hypothetical protein
MYENLFLFTLDIVTRNLALRKPLADMANPQPLLVWWNEGIHF